MGELVERLEAAERRIHELEAGRTASESDSILPASHDSRGEFFPGSCPTPQFGEASIGHGSSTAKSAYYVDYDKGFVIRPYDPEKNPFELQINGRMQFRYTGLQRDRRYFINRGGIVPVHARNDFEIERGRLTFQGFMWDPKLRFYMKLDADTDDNHQAALQGYWVSYEFSKAFELFLGKSYVPGSYDWISGSTRTHFADRSMATTFFRPDRSLGIWASGEIADGLHYRTMIANGFSTSDLEPDQIDKEFTYSHIMWWDALGDVGRGYADLEWHEDPALRIGSAYTFADLDPDVENSPTAEQNFARLSDGTKLVTPNALAPGRTVHDFDLHLLSAFFNAKYRGWSINSEFYFRWLQDLETQERLPLPTNKLYADGFYTDVGYMLVPGRLEAIGRVSAVDGMFGDSWEYAGGFNWYFNGKHTNKFTFDASVLDGIPASNSGPNYEVGQDGVLFRAQYQAAF